MKTVFVGYHRNLLRLASGRKVPVSSITFVHDLRSTQGLRIGPEDEILWDPTFEHEDSYWIMQSLENARRRGALT